MKIFETLIFSTILIFSLNHLKAQEAAHSNLPVISYKDYGFKNIVKKAVSIYYLKDSLKITATMEQGYLFNDKGNITQKYIKILGKYASQTYTYYIYKNGLLDSIKTRASAKNFNNDVHFEYNKEGKIVKSHGIGYYTNYTDFFAYQNNKLVNSLRTYPNSNNKIECNYHYKHNILNYVEEINISKSNKKTTIDTTTYYYSKEKLFASYNSKGEKITFYDTPYGDLEKTIKKTTKSVILDSRKLYEENPEEFSRTIETKFVKSAQIVNKNYQETNAENDWIYMFEYNNAYGQKQKRYIFQEVVYPNDKVSGSTKFDSFFEKRVKQKLAWIPQDLF
ncbi:hypothetical protein [Pedobacter alpinus]|uniref:YD repeat-containing protein n=1 Tax=Pedobacter alpinus TaxID=1590643 RepID=A0ABW5TR46_9SPHI